MLMAYADDALSDKDRRRVESVLAADPAQRERLEPYIVTRSALPGIFSEALTSAMPARLIDTVMTAPIGMAASKRESATSVSQRLISLFFPTTPSWQGAFALCSAALVIAGAGWLAGRASRPEASPQEFAAADSALVASGPLKVALETAASNASVEQGLIKATPALTFRDADGRFCRQYTTVEAGAGSYAGFACRTAPGRWTVAYHAPASDKGSAASAEGYTPAGLEDPLEANIDKVIKGDVLQRGEEAALIARGWIEEKK